MKYIGFVISENEEFIIYSLYREKSQELFRDLMEHGTNKGSKIDYISLEKPVTIDLLERMIYDHYISQDNSPKKALRKYNI